MNGFSNNLYGKTYLKNKTVVIIAVFLQKKIQLWINKIHTIQKQQADPYIYVGLILNPDNHFTTLKYFFNNW